MRNKLIVCSMMCAVVQVCIANGPDEKTPLLEKEESKYPQLHPTAPQSQTMDDSHSNHVLMVKISNERVADTLKDIYIEGCGRAVNDVQPKQALATFFAKNYSQKNPLLWTDWEKKNQTAHEIAKRLNSLEEESALESMQINMKQEKKLFMWLCLKSGIELATIKNLIRPSETDFVEKACVQNERGFISVENYLKRKTDERALRDEKREKRSTKEEGVEFAVDRIFSSSVDDCCFDKGHGGCVCFNDHVCGCYCCVEKKKFTSFLNSKMYN